MKTRYSYPTMKKMKNNTNNMARMARRLTLSCLVLLFMVGNALAQSSDPQFVIKYTDAQETTHYLSRVNNEGTWSITDATTFNPNCLWYSGNNYNYYFLDGNNKKYLTAPLECDGAITIEADPGQQVLDNTTLNYFFYNWDTGLARGIETNNWEHVVWVSYQSQWQMSSTYSYNPTANAAQFYRVTVTEHAQDITSTTGGLSDLTGFEMEFNDNPLTSHAVSASVTPYSYTYTPAYTTYVFDGATHNYYDSNGNGTSTDNGNSTPDPITSNGTGNGNTVTSYAWTLTGDGADFLSFANDENPVLEVSGATASSQNVYYITENNDNTIGHQTATLTLTVTYSDNSTQVSEASILVKISCQNPSPNYPEITFEDVTFSWTNTADKYLVQWKKRSSDWNSDESAIVEGATSYTITGLEYGLTYDYRVTAYCNDVLLPYSEMDISFPTPNEPSALVYGAVFGGGRMANVGGKTEVVVINCEELGAIYGGNDIAGAVQGTDGSTIILGVNEGDTYASYGTTSAEIKIGDVYGGGNGYYAYNGSSFEPASADYDSQTVASGASIRAMTQSHQVGDAVWTNEDEDDYTWYFPSIVKTNITVASDKVKVDTIFGGAKTPS